MAGSGLIYSFSDTTTLRTTIDEIISILDPRDIPVLTALGGLDGGRSKFKFLDAPNHTIKWQQDTMRVRTATLNESTFGTTATDPIVVTGQGVRFKVGDIWKVESTGELWRIDALTAGSDQLTTVTRNWAAAMGGSQGTATSGPTNADTLTYQYPAIIEGADAVNSPFTAPTQDFNYDQLFDWTIEITKSELEGTTRYGIEDQFKYQLMKALGGGPADERGADAGDLLIDVNNTWYGLNGPVAWASGVAGAMGGFKSFVTTNAYAAGGAYLDEDMLLNRMQAAWSAGGKVDTIFCNAFQKRRINAMFRDVIRTERNERMGGMMIDSFESDFGMTKIILDRRCPTTELDIVQTNKAGYVTTVPWYTDELGQTGHKMKWLIGGQFSLVVKDEAAHAVITGLADS